MSDGIFVLVEGRMEVLRRASVEDDALLSSLVEQHPEVIAAAAGKDEQRRLLLVRRRVGAGRASAGPTGWVYVDSEAVPIMVEVQPTADPLSGAEAMGMLLDSVASGVPEWHGWRMREVFQLTHVGRNDVELLAETLGWEGDPDTFWAEAEANLANHRVRLMLVTDSLSEDVLRVIDFLNDQMRDVEAFGVEVALYGAGPTKAFVPRAGRDAPNGRQPKIVTGNAGRHRLPG